MLKMEMARSCLGARVYRANFLVGEFQGLHGLPICVFFILFYFFWGFGVLECAWMQFDHLITLALIPIDVYVGGK